MEDKWIKRVQLMRQVGTTSLGDDARETLTIAGLETAREGNLEQQVGLNGIVCKRGSVPAHYSGFERDTATPDCQRVLAVARVDPCHPQTCKCWTPVTRELESPRPLSPANLEVLDPVTRELGI